MSIEISGKHFPKEKFGKILTSNLSIKLFRDKRKIIWHLLHIIPVSVERKFQTPLFEIFHRRPQSPLTYSKK